MYICFCCVFLNISPSLFLDLHEPSWVTVFVAQDLCETLELDSSACPADTRRSPNVAPVHQMLAHRLRCWPNTIEQQW